MLFILYVMNHNCLILVFLNHNKHADANTTAVPAVILADLFKDDLTAVISSCAHFAGLMRFIRLYNYNNNSFFLISEINFEDIRLLNIYEGVSQLCVCTSAM